MTRALALAGTERQLVSLACGLRERGHEPVVATLRGGHAFADELAAAGVERFDAGVRSRGDLPRALGLLARLRRLRPDVVYGFHPESNLAALALGRSLPDCAVVWGVRWSDSARFPEDALARRILAASNRLARLPDLTIANSEAGRLDALAHGFPPERVLRVDNGIDTERFRPDGEGGRGLRAAWGVAAEEVLVGMVARRDRAKDHDTFLRAASSLAQRRPEVRFALVGEGVPAEPELHDRIVWAGPRSDLPAVYSALDVAVLASRYGESLPNSLAEAMSCGVPCVATDTGDNRRLLGATGRIVPVADQHALAAAIDAVLAERATLGPAARARIVECFGRERMIVETEAALAALVRCGPVDASTILAR